MNRRITQRELRNESGRIMRALDKGESFTVTRNGVAVGELVPVKLRVFVATEAVSAAYRTAPRLAYPRVRKNVDYAVQSGPDTAWVNRHKGSVSRSTRLNAPVRSSSAQRNSAQGGMHDEELRRVGWFAMLTDPQGNDFALWQTDSKAK